MTEAFKPLLPWVSTSYPPTHLPDQSSPRVSWRCTLYAPFIALQPDRVLWAIRRIRKALSLIRMTQGQGKWAWNVCTNVNSITDFEVPKALDSPGGLEGPAVYMNPNPNPHVRQPSLGVRRRALVIPSFFVQSIDVVLCRRCDTRRGSEHVMDPCPALPT